MLWARYGKMERGWGRGGMVVVGNKCMYVYMYLL